MISQINDSKWDELASLWRTCRRDYCQNQMSRLVTHANLLRSADFASDQPVIEVNDRLFDFATCFWP